VRVLETGVEAGCGVLEGELAGLEGFEFGVEGAGAGTGAAEALGWC
jgi:hypothetical protein